MSKVIAHTKLDPVYPGYINFYQNEDGSVTVHLRGDPKVTPGAYVCGHAGDYGKHGRCTPGDQNCNNYCNSAPQKGPMQPHPKECQSIQESPTTLLVLSAEEWAVLKAEVSKS